MRCLCTLTFYHSRRNCLRLVAVNGDTMARTDPPPAPSPLPLFSTDPYRYPRTQVEKNFKGAGLESAAFFRPSTLVGNANTAGWQPVVSKMVSWALPMKYKEIHIDALGTAMVKAAVASLDAGGPASTRYEGASLFALLKP